MILIIKDKIQTIIRLRIKYRIFIRVLNVLSISYDEVINLLKKSDHMKVSAANKARTVEGAIIVMASLVLLYLLISLYFANHFFMGTTINGVKVSLKSHKAADKLILSHVNNYKLVLLERGGLTEYITGQQIALTYKQNKDISTVFQLQNQLLWPVMFFRKHDYFINDLIVFNDVLLEKRINELDCLNKNIVEPRDASFIYKEGSYDVKKEVEGNKVNKEQLAVLISNYIMALKTELNLEKENCYYKPRFTIHDKKTLMTRDILNKYVSAKIKYKFENRYELVDGNVISRWLIIDDNLDVKINEKAINDYIKWLANKYDTVGITREFKTSTGKTVKVEGGLYGWKINQKAEAEALIKNIMQADKIEKEPIYEQKAISRGELDYGNTYIEISITRQHLWFYKDGKLITQGDVVTGNPNRGNATVTGTYFVVYKEKDAVLTGPGYEAKVTYWMPFFGNMGLHDASWRRAFGGEIYKRNGTHGCVNAPRYLAKKIFESIDEGVPVIIYEEEREVN